jgi:hypothetical protein
VAPGPVEGRRKLWPHIVLCGDGRGLDAEDLQVFFVTPRMLCVSATQSICEARVLDSNGPVLSSRTVNVTLCPSYLRNTPVNLWPYHTGAGTHLVLSRATRGPLPLWVVRPPFQVATGQRHVGLRTSRVYPSVPQRWSSRTQGDPFAGVSSYTGHSRKCGACSRAAMSFQDGRATADRSPLILPGHGERLVSHSACFI